jgi:hypothetical protein
MGTRRRLAVLGVGLALVCASCRRKAIEETPSAAPPDRLLPGELVEGTERAFGLPLPRESRVLTRFATSVHVTSSATPEQLKTFLQARTSDGKWSQRDETSRVGGLIPRDDKNKRLTLDIRPIRTGDGQRSEMIVQDATPPPFDPTLSEEERWKKAGMTPQGQILDPTHLE